jgi:hypothetical protein
VARPQNPSPQGRGESRAVAVLARVYWMLIGLFPLAISAAWIAQSDHSPSPADAVFLLSVLALIGVRYLDIAYLAGQTADGDSATLVHWRRYAIRTVAAATALWVGVTAAARLVAE